MDPRCHWVMQGWIGNLLERGPAHMHSSPDAISHPTPAADGRRTQLSSTSFYYTLSVGRRTQRREY
jgi:hypothetical protein